MTATDQDPSSERSSPVPVTVLTGFLGAGKSTLLNRILRGDHGLRVGVLVNDFGSVNIDAELVVGVGSDSVISLANGCVCCSIRGDLVEAVLEMIERPERPEYIVLEASGIADPSGIALTFVDDSSMLERVRLDSITCLVDAEQFLADHDHTEVKTWQIAFSDLLILNKVDLVDERGIEAITDWLDDRFHRYRLVEATRGDVPLEILLGVGRFDPARFESDADRLDRADRPTSFDSWSFEDERPLSLDALREAARHLPADIYRAKGIVHSSDEPERRAILQVVGKRVDVSIGDAWGQRRPRTQIVAIGKPGGTSGARFHEMFDACRNPMPDG